MQNSSVFPKGQQGVGIEPLSGKGPVRAERPTPSTSSGTAYPDVNSLKETANNMEAANAVAPNIRLSKHGTFFNPDKITHHPDLG